MIIGCRMESQGGRDEKDEPRGLLQSDPLKITIASDLSALELPANATNSPLPAVADGCACWPLV